MLGRAKKVEQVSEETFKSQRPQPQSRSPKKRASQASQTQVPGGGLWRPNASINNLATEKKKEVDKAINEKVKLRKRRFRARVIAKASLVTFILVGGFFLIGLSSRRLHMEMDQGASEDYKSSLESSLSNRLNGGILGFVNPAFMRYRAIEDAVPKQKDEVGSLDLSYNFIKFRTEAKVKMNVPLVKWVSPEGSVSLVNQKGRVFEPDPGFASGFKPLELSGSGIGVAEGSKAIASADKLEWVVSVIPVLREQGIEPTKVNIDGESFKNVEVVVGETRLIFSIEEDSGQSGFAAAKSINHLQKSRAGGLAGLSYIDVRSPERVLYR